MSFIRDCHDILKDSKFFKDFESADFLIKKNGELVSSFKEYHANIKRLGKQYPDSRKFNGDTWEFLSLFYMVYERNLICKNHDGEEKKFKVDLVQAETNDYGTDFFISHNNETIPVQCKFKSDISKDLDPDASKLDNFILNARQQTTSKYYILITSTIGLKYTIKDSLTDVENFFYITLDSMANNNIDIEFFKAFYNSIKNIVPKINIINTKPVSKLKVFEEKVDSQLSLSDFPRLESSIKIPDNIFISKNNDISEIITQYIILKFFQDLGPYRYDPHTNTSYVVSDKYKQTFIFKYYYSNEDKISSNNSNLSKKINNMDDNFSGCKYEPKLILLSNVDDFYDTTFKEMTYGKVASIINYEKLLIKYNCNDELEDFMKQLIK